MIHECENVPLYEVMLDLVRAAVIVDYYPELYAQRIDWNILMDYASEQGLLAWVWDGICKMGMQDHLSRQQRINWGLSAQEIWDRYNMQKAVLVNLISECQINNMRLLLLKGIGLSTLYPNPKSRPCGDIDIFLFDDYEKGNELFAKGEGYIGVKDLGFYYDGVYIENHHTLIYTDTKKRVKANDYIKKSLSECSLNADGYYELPPIANVVYLLLHTLSHMDSEYVVSIRSVFDFGMLIHRQRSQLGKDNCCIEVMRKLGLLRPFCLLIELSKYYLKIPFSEFESIRLPSEDIQKAIYLVENKKAKQHIEDSDSLLTHWRYSVYRHFQIRWMYKYIPRSIGEHIVSTIRREASLIVRTLLSISSQTSVREYIKDTLHISKRRMSR